MRPSISRGEEVAMSELDELLEGGALEQRRYDRKGVIAAGALLAAGAYASRAESALGAFSGAGQAGTLHYYNWADYVNPKTRAAFTKATGIKVKMSYFVSNEALLAKLKAGARGYDLATPTGYMVKVLADEKLLTPIDHSKLPNVKKYLDAKFRSTPDDPGNKWSVAKDYGTTGFMYRTDKIKERPKTWKQFFALFKKYPKKFTILDSPAEPLGSIAVMLGYSYNTDSPKELDEVRKFLLGLKPYVHSIDAVNYKTNIAKGRAYGGLGWNGDGFYVVANSPKNAAEYVVASEGGEVWVDYYVIPAGPKNPDAAHAFINYVYTPKTNKAETEYTYYGSPLRRAALASAYPKSLLNNTDVFPTAPQLKRLEFNTVSASGYRLRNRIWTEFKSA
jgi:spermidine/putrescine transport system substrate-binding protein